MRNAVQQYIFSEIKEKKEINQVYNFLFSKSEKEKKICIFGAGKYGKEIFAELRKRLIDTYCFTDNNPDKYGYLLEGKYCIPLSYLEKEKDEILIIIAVKNPKWLQEIQGQLIDHGITSFVSMQEVNEIIAEVPPVKWLDSMKDISEIDLVSLENIELIARINQLIFDICKYYEERK